MRHFVTKQTHDTRSLFENIYLILKSMFMF